VRNVESSKSRDGKQAGHTTELNGGHTALTSTGSAWLDALAWGLKSSRVYWDEIIDYARG